MAGGKHRKHSRCRSSVARRRVPDLAAAAVSAASLSTALLSGTTATVTASQVKPMALVTPANSTAQIFASSTYYGVDWSTQYGPAQVVPFYLGPQGIVAAVDSNSSDPQGTAVLSSGWGAGQTSTALAMMQANNDPAMNNLKLVVLDNDTNRAGGGFWTTYWMFAPLLLTSSAPTPSDTNAPVVDVAYEYNINSDAPTYPIDLLADANSLVAYLYDYGAQATAPMPPVALQPVVPGAQHYSYVVAPDGTIDDKVPVNGNITYVTFESAGLPLVEPLRIIPGGNVLADAVQPTLTVLVNWGYQDDQPIPGDPGVTRPVGLLPPASQDAAALQQFADSVPQGLQAAQSDLSSLTSGVTSPLASVSTQVTPAVAPPKLATLSAATVNTKGGNKVSPASGTTSTSGGNRVQQVVGTVRSTLGGLEGGLTKGVQKKTTSSH
jgi:hypothetical protein